VSSAARSIFRVILADDPSAQAHDGAGTNDNDGGGVGRNSGWAAGDEVGAPFKGKGDTPVRYLEVHEQLWKYTLVWLFWPSLLVTLGVWWGLNNWLHLPDWTAWFFLGAAAALYVVVGLRGHQLLSLASRLRGRRPDLR
jgi:hypothetical protein